MARGKPGRPGPPQLSPCRLCGPLPQATVHFDADYWQYIKEMAEKQLAELRAEIAEADKHIRMLATPPPSAPR